jgi:ribonucleotide reductase alpha subunit
LADHAKEWLIDNKIELTENFKTATENIIAANDTFQDFIDTALIVTTNDKDRADQESLSRKTLATYSSHEINKAVTTGSRSERRCY